MSEFADIVGQIDIFREPADGVVGFRERCAAFKDEVVTERRSIKCLQRPDVKQSKVFIRTPAGSVPHGNQQ